VGVSRDFPIFWVPPYYLRNGKSYEFQVWPLHLHGPSEQKPIKRDRGCIQGLPNFFQVPPIISGTGKATDFKFSQYIQSGHPNKSPLNILEKGSVGLSRHCLIFRVPLIILGTGKATNFKFCMRIYGLNRNKSPLKFREK